MSYPPRILTETWIFIAYLTEPECAVAQQIAMNNIIKVFGNIVIAEKYLETFEYDKQIETA